MISVQYQVQMTPCPLDTSCPLKLTKCIHTSHTDNIYTHHSIIHSIHITCFHKIYHYSIVDVPHFIYSHQLDSFVRSKTTYIHRLPQTKDLDINSDPQTCIIKPLLCPTLRFFQGEIFNYSLAETSKP